MTRLKIIILIVVFGVIVLFPDMLSSMLAAFAHLLVEFAHLLFEILEVALDHVIEHLFETDLHDTQIIVFYIIMAFFAYLAYLLWRVLPRFCCYCKSKVVEEKNYRKEQLNHYWLHKSIMHKITVVTVSVSLILSYLIFFL